jgi:hypothetical protein
MKNTPQPWELRKMHGTEMYGGKSNASDWFLFECALEKDAARIVACVNACAGISNEELKDISQYFGRDGRTYYTLVADMRKAQAQRDELLEALEMAAAVMTACDAPEVSQKTVREVIAKMKKEEV